MRIEKTSCAFVAEKLKSTFGFKGGYLSELWQVVCKITAGDLFGVGVGVQSVLWSDEKVFLSNSEKDGNAFMYKTSEYALKLLEGRTFSTPVALIDSIFDEVMEYAKSITGEKNLRATFVRNALVPVDNALWQLYAKREKIEDLSMLVEKEYAPYLSNKQDKLCCVPLISYKTSEKEIRALIENGAVLLKIKIGNDESNKLTKEQMLEWDKNRIKQIHDIAKEYFSEYSKSGKILYYLDANGKYDSLKRVKDLVDYLNEIDALSSTVLFEEPFEEQNKIDLSSLPVRFAADESVHSERDVIERVNLGYKAITLKPIAKTLSETLKILKTAKGLGAICFCADLTVNPLLVEWNKNVASRIDSLPELKIGILESNGEQNYLRWDILKSYSPSYNKPFSQNQKGVYTLDQEFFTSSGGIFLPSNYYDHLV